MRRTPTQRRRRKAARWKRGVRRLVGDLKLDSASYKGRGCGKRLLRDGIKKLARLEGYSIVESESLAPGKPLLGKWTGNN